MGPQRPDQHRPEAELSAARLRALALVPFSPAWDAAMGAIEELERALWRVEAVPFGDDRIERLDGTWEAIPSLSVPGRRQRRRKRPPDFLASGTAGTVLTPSSPNALEVSRASRSAGAERAAPMTTGTPSLTALR